MRVDIAQKLSGLSIVELHIQRILILLPPDEDVFARFKKEIAYSDRYLCDEKVGIFPSAA